MAISSSSSSSSSSMATLPFLPPTSQGSSLSYRRSSYSIIGEDEQAAVNWHRNSSEGQAVLDVKGTAARASDLFECTICSSEVDQSQIASIPHTNNTRCESMHNDKICTPCLDRWRQINNLCPFCRDPLEPIPPAEESPRIRKMKAGCVLVLVLGVATGVVLGCLKGNGTI